MNFFHGFNQARETSFSNSLFPYNCTMKKYMKYPGAFHLTKKTVIKDFFSQTLLLKRQNALVLIRQNFLSIFMLLLKNLNF